MSDHLLPQKEKQLPPRQGLTHACPFLGLPKDPTTRYQYPSSHNYCHVPDLPEPVREAHQESYCLTQNHLDCPLYSREDTTTLPPSIRRVPSSALLFTPRRIILTVLALVILGGLIYLAVLTLAEAPLL